MTRLRVLLVVLIVVFNAGAPELGLETRVSSGDTTFLALLYILPFLGAISALVATWPWPRAAAWLGAMAAAWNALLAAADLAGLTDPERPPLAIAVVEAITIAAAVGILFAAWRLVAAWHSGAPAASRS